MNIEVLVATMKQSDMRKYDEMNLQTDAIIANQADRYAYQEKMSGESTVRMISTTTIGLSRNRNIALSMSTGDYIVFADDDLQFIDGYAHIIEREFMEHPEADAIKFNLKDISKRRKISMQSIEKYERATMLNMGASVVVGLVIKKDVLVRTNLKFNEQFGAGTENYCGEDTIFFHELLKHKVKIFRSPKVIAKIDQTESSWFEGHNRKYFEVSGKIFATMYPKLSWLIVIRSAYRFSKRADNNMSFGEILRCYFRGIQNNGEK